MSLTKKKNSAQKANHNLQPLVRVTISLDPDDYAAFDILAKQSRLSRAWLIRKAMSEFLDRSRKPHLVKPLSGRKD